MYSNSKFVAKKDNFISDIGISAKGVKQGDSLSPLLFNVFVNDIDTIFDPDLTYPVSLETTKLNCLMYAGDLLLLLETKEGLKSCLDSLEIYCNNWKLKINTEKTKVMIFCNRKCKTQTKYVSFSKLSTRNSGTIQICGCCIIL